MPNGTDILITGGYGTVGRRVAADLAPDYPDRVIVAGRSAERSARLAAELGHGVRGRRVDVGDPDSVEAALGGVGLVMSCIDQPEPHLLHAAIRRGLAYTDIAPHLMTRRPTEAMKGEAAQRGARIVLGTGLAPGISSMLARLGADRVGAVDSVEVGVLLSVGDTYGPASRAYLLEEIALPYAVRIEGRETPACPFGRHDRVTFPPPLGRRVAYLFPFSDLPERSPPPGSAAGPTRVLRGSLACAILCARKGDCDEFGERAAMARRSREGKTVHRTPGGRQGAGRLRRWTSGPGSPGPASHAGIDYGLSMSCGEAARPWVGQPDK